MLPYRFFCQINGTLAAYGQPRLLDPPRRERLRPNPVEALEIRNQRGEITLRLRVPKAPAAFTFVFGVRWCSRGMSVPRSNGVLLGPLPQAMRGWREITDLYVNKFGQPPPSSRVLDPAGHQRPERPPQADPRRCAPAAAVTARP